MLKVILAIALVLMSVTAIAPAQEYRCTPLAAALAQIPTMPGYVSHEVLEGERRVLAQAVFASLADGNLDDWDTVVIVDGLVGGMIVVGKNKELCRMAILSAPMWRTFKNGLDGIPA